MAHLKRIPLVCLALALLTEQSWADDPMALPERSTAIFVSNRDVNRVYCPAAIDDVVWSAEKPANRASRVRTAMRAAAPATPWATVRRFTTPGGRGGPVRAVPGWPR